MIFVKRHPALFGLFLFSLYLMVKNSAIPYPFDPPIIVSILFDSPQSAFFSELAPLIDIFASAYVTSLLFYLLVDYLPTLKAERKAKGIISPSLTNLTLYISELLARIEYEAKKKGVFQTGNIDDMDQLPITETTIYCREIRQKNGEKSWSGIISYNLFEGCHSYRTLILDTCTKISCTPSFLYCDEQLIGIISEIKLNHLLEILPQPNDILHEAGVIPINVGAGKGYQALKKAYKELCQYTDIVFECALEDVSPKEVDEHLKKNMELLKLNPKAAEVLAIMQKRKQEK